MKLKKDSTFVISGDYLHRFHFPDWDYNGSEIYFEDRMIGIVTRCDRDKRCVLGKAIWFDLTDDVDFKTEVRLERLMELGNTNRFSMKLTVGNPNRIFLSLNET